MRKLSIALCFLSMIARQGFASPVVVARFGNGLILGTNEVQADGSKACKLHAAKHAVVLMSAPAAVDGGETGGTWSKMVAQRLDRALSGQDLSMTKLTELVQNSGEAAAREMLGSVESKNILPEAFLLRFILIDAEDSGVSVFAFNLRLRSKNPEVFDIEPVDKTVQINELQDYSQLNVHMKHIAPSEEAAIEAVRQQLVSDTRIQSAKPTQTYQPPFSILEMRNDGTMTLITPPGECNQERINTAAGQ